MSMKILDRYIAKELILPFIIGFLTFLVLMVGNLLFQNIDYILRQGISFLVVAKLVIYSIPSLLLYTFPVAVILASSLAVNRLARDSEMVAIRIAGISFWRVLIPIGVFGLLMSFVSFLNGEKIAPWAEHHAQNVVREMWQTEPVPTVEPDVFFSSQDTYFYIKKVEHIDSRTAILNDIMIWQPSAGGQYPVFTTARKAWCKENVWYLEDGIRHEMDSRGFSKLETSFSKMTLNLKRPLADFLSDSRGTHEMDMGQLRQQMVTLKRGGIRISPDIMLEFQFKLALPLACLVVGLCSAPLGLKFAKSGSLIGILLSILVVFLYHNTMLFCKAMAISGKVSPILGAWTPNLIFVLVGIYLNWKER